MKLLAKFNLVLLTLYGAGSVLIGFATRSFLVQNARSQVLQQAELMAESARATRQYTADELAPLLERLPDHDTKFLPETIPFYAATTTFDYLRKKYPDYAYKEAALNPSNLRDRAVEWEADIIDYFRNQNDAKQVIGERDTPTGRMLYVAYPISSEAPCLQCHSEASVAPRTILRKYGSVNGFGWKPNEVIGAQIVSVPIAVPLGIAHRAFRELVIYLIAIFLIAVAVIDATLLHFVIRPVRKLSESAERISKGDMNVAELPVEGKDEIALVTASFNRMFVSLQKAFGMLKH